MAKFRKIRMPIENKIEVAEVIQNLRAKLDLTQEQFAAKVGRDLVNGKPLVERAWQAISFGHETDTRIDEIEQHSEDKERYTYRLDELRATRDVAGRKADRHHPKQPRHI